MWRKNGIRRGYQGKPFLETMSWLPFPFTSSSNLGIFQVFREAWFLLTGSWIFSLVFLVWRSDGAAKAKACRRSGELLPYWTLKRQNKDELGGSILTSPSTCKFSNTHVETSEQTTLDLNLTRIQRSQKGSDKQAKQFQKSLPRESMIKILQSQSWLYSHLPLLSEGVPCDSTTLQNSFCKLPWTVFHVPWVQERGWSHPQLVHAG